MNELRTEKDIEPAKESTGDIQALFGSQLEDFYMHLRDGNPNELGRAMGALEYTAQAAEEQGNASGHSAILDIVVDCQKKCAQSLRSKVADKVSTLLASTRKKIRAKAALDSDSSSLHNQRHKQHILELLGNWSDIIANVVQGGFSAKITSLVIVPFHLRVMEVAFECFEQFKSDKNIANWLSRVQNPEIELNLVALDAVLVQLAGMRELTAQYHAFLTDNCSIIDLPNESFDPWKELDVIYCALDNAYNGMAVCEAIKDAKKGLLLCIEDVRPVYVLQGVEDAFFVIGRSVNRAISTGSDMILFSAMNR